MSGVLVDREALERVLSLFPDTLRPGQLGGFQPDVARSIYSLRAALALPAQAAADAAELHRLAVEASRTDSTSSAVRHARDELVRVCLSLGGEA